MSPSKLSRDSIVWAYRLFLGREQESEAAIDSHLSRLTNVAELRNGFLNSGEFAALSPIAARMTLNGDEPARVVETGGDSKLLERVFDHVNRSWQHLGETDPYWSVLTAPEYRGKPSQEHIARFFASGKAEIERLRKALERSGDRLDGRVTCLEYGCGLGRITRQLVPHFERTIGVDISAAHLELAEQLATADGIGGIEWLHLESLDKLNSLPGADFIYSVIVLQHNPPPVIERILQSFARILRPGGIAHFQVPTYRADYEFRLADYVRNQLGHKAMEMHTYPQQRIFEIFADAGAVPLQVVEDGATGLRRGERSNTFTFRKRQDAESVIVPGPMNVMKATTEDVRHAYRLLLGREPDPTGLATFKKLIARGDASAMDVAAVFFSSAEFTVRHAIFPVLDEVIFQGLKLYPWRGDDLIGALVKSTGEYESYMLPLFVEHVPVGGTVLDIGANIGIYTLLAARKAGEQGRVIAIEPIARNVQSICAGVVGNGFCNVSVIPVAASAQAGVVPMLRHSNSSNGIVDAALSAASADCFVPAQRLDFLLGALDRLDVIKIDIEGHEPIAWPGFEALVRKHHPVVFTEFNPVAIRNHSRVDPEGYLRELFLCAGTLQALHLDGRRIDCTSPEEVMEQWRDANRRQGSEYGYHLDLMLDTRS